MYSPPYNRIEDRAELLAFLRAHSFAVLVTRELRASHLPVQVRATESELILDMHMARANPQWQDFFDDEALVVFSGPHAYVSPRWYEEQERVPTWNYASVHAYGVPKVIQDRNAKHASQRRLVTALDPQWLAKFDALRREYGDSMLEGIGNFEIAGPRVETRWKLSQNRRRREQELVSGALHKTAGSTQPAPAAVN